MLTLVLLAVLTCARRKFNSGKPWVSQRGQRGGDARQPTEHKREEGLKANVNERLRRAWQTGDGVDGDGEGDGDVDERQTGLKLT